MAWIAAAAAVVSAAASIGQGISGKKQAKQLGRLNEAIIREEGAETERRFLRETEAALDVSRAARGASGVSAESGSFQTFIASQQEEAKKQLSFIRKSMESRAEAAREGAQAAGQSALLSGIGGAAGILGSAASSGAFSGFGGGG